MKKYAANPIDIKPVLMIDKCSWARRAKPYN